MERASLIQTTLDHKEKFSFQSDLARRAREVPMEAAERISEQIRSTSMKINVNSVRSPGGGSGISFGEELT